MHPNFSVIIVTKNRFNLLYRCIESLIQQPFSKEDEILIINNGESLLNHPVTAHTAGKRNRTTIKIFSSNGTISHCRNIGLGKAKNNWCIFIDDDCLATKNWLQVIQNAIENNSSTTLFTGPAASTTKNNVFSLATRFHYEYWVKENTLSDKMMNLILLDTKNCVVNKQFITKHAILFDESLRLGEDSDFGLQIQQKGGTGIYLHTALVLHADPVTLKGYITKQCAYTFSAMILLRKWTDLYPNKTREESILLATIKYTSSIPSLLLQISVFLLLIATHMINKLVFFLFYHNLVRQQLQKAQDISFAQYFRNSSEV